MHFITNGYKRFSKTNSTDPRQRVPLMFDALYTSNHRGSILTPTGATNYAYGVIRRFFIMVMLSVEVLNIAHY